MANNVVQVKRTNTSGRTPNTTGSYATNSQYISAGELALNMVDGILYTSNGSALIEIGANNTTQRITNALIVNNDKRLNFNTVNTNVSAYFIQQNDDNFVFYTTNAAYGARPVWSIYANSDTSAINFGVPVNFNGTNVNFGSTRIFANGTSGTAGQVLTSNGTATYWSTVTGGGGSVNTAAQYTWTNTQIFQANVSFTGNGIGIASNTGAIYLGGISDANWKIARNSGVVTKWRYTNNTIDIVTANSNLEGFTIGLVSGNSYFETGYLGTFVAANLTIGNASSNSTINSTAFSGTANNASFLGGIAAASYVNTSQLSANLSNYQTTAGLSANVATLTANNSTFAFGKSEGNLNVNNATTVGGNTASTLRSYSDTTAATAYSNAVSVAATDASTKAGTAYTNAVAYVDGKSYVNSAQLSSNLSNYAALSGATFTGAVVVSNNLSVTGNLTLSGNTLIVGANNLVVSDAVISLHTPANLASLTSNDGKNIGLAFHYYDTEDKHALLYRDNSTGRLQYHNDGGDPLTNSNPTGNNLGVIQANVFWSGNDSVYATTNSTVYTGTANNASFLGGTAAASYVQNTDSRTLSGNLTFSGITTFSGNIVVGNTSANSQVFQRSSNATVNVVSISTTASPTGGSPTNSLTKTTTQSTGRYVQTRLQSGVSQGLIEAFATNDNNQIYSSITGSATSSSTGAGTTALLDLQYQSFITFNYSRIRITTGDNDSNIYMEKNGNSWSLIETNQVKVVDVGGTNSVINTTAVSTSNSVIYGGGRLTLVSNAGIVANGSFGTAGQVLHSNGSSAYWADDDQGVTSVATGNGMTGGTITATGTVSVLANTGIVANATGTFVNATYIGTISSNNASFLGGVAAANYVRKDQNNDIVENIRIRFGAANQTDVNDGTIAAGLFANGLNIVGTQTQAGTGRQISYFGTLIDRASAGATFVGDVGIGNTTPNAKLQVTGTANVSGNVVIGGNLRITGGLIANGSLGTANQVLVTNGSSVYWANSGSGATSSITRQIFNGDGTSTSFTVTGGYTAGQIDVYLNGVKQLNGTDVTVSSGTAIVFAVAPASGSVIEVTAITVSNVVTANEVGGYYKGGATTVGSAGNANNIFRINGKTLFNNTNINSDENGSCAGPIAISSGVSLTIAPGGRIVIV